MDGHGNYTYSSLYTKMKCAPPHPCASEQNPSQPPCRRSTLESYSLAALLLINLRACCEHIAQGVLFEESGAHKRQIAGAIPTHPSQTALILASEIAINISRFLPVTQYFLGHNFWRADLAGAHKWNMHAGK